MKNKETIKYISLGLILLAIFFLPKEVSAGIGQSILDATFGTAFSSLGLVFAGLMAALLDLAGYAFDKTISLTLLNPQINNVEAVKIGWRIIRDVSNLFLIFALVFIAIATILQIESYGVKKLILPLILVALLINFSLAITKFVIDISNILALQFYYAVEVQTPGPETANAPQTEYKSLSSVFMAGTKLQSVYQYNFAKESSDNPNAETAPRPKTEEITNWEIGKAQWLGGILFAIAAFVFFAGAILFIIRQVSLLILMVLSPLAFVFGIFPGTQQHSKKLWNTLFSQAFFAPAYLFMFYLTAKIAQDSSFLDLIGVGTKYSSLGKFLAEGTASGSLAAPDGGYFINFLIMAALMIGALWVAKQMGAVGADMTWEWGGNLKKKLRGYAGGLGRLATKHTIGRAGEEIASSQWMKEGAARHPIIGGYFARMAKKVGKTGQLDKLREEQIAMGMTLSPEQRAKFMIRSQKAVREGMFGKMSDREIAEMQMKASDEERGKIDSWIASMPEAKREKVYEAMGKRDLERDNKDIGDEEGLISIFFKRKLATQRKILSEIKKERLPSLIQGMNPAQKEAFVEIAKKAGGGLDAKIFKADPTLAGLKGTDDEKIEAMAKEIRKGINIEDINEALATDKLFMEALVRGLQPGAIEKLKDRGDALSVEYTNSLQALANGSNKRADIVNALRTTAKNESAARYFESHLAPELFGLAKEPAATTSPAASGAAGTTTPPIITIPNVIGGRGGQRYSPPSTPTTGGGQPTTPPSSGQPTSTPTPPAGPGRSSGGPGRTAGGGSPGRP